MKEQLKARTYAEYTCATCVYETAGWLAPHVADVYRNITRNKRDIILHGDIRGARITRALAIRGYELYPPPLPPSPRTMSRSRPVANIDAKFDAIAIGNGNYLARIGEAVRVA